MNNSNENINSILSFLKKHMFKLNIKSFFNVLTTSLIIGSLFFMLFEAIALLIPLYYVHIYGLSAVCISILVAFIFHLFHKINLKDTALFLDSFGFKEGLITALENKDSNLTVSDIQRKQIAHTIREKSESIKYSILPSSKKVLIILGILCLSIGLIFVPSPAKDAAKENHQLVKQIKEKEKQISELINELKEKPIDSLSEKDKQALNDLMAALSSSYSEYKNVTNSQQLIAANERLSYKLEQIENHMTNEELNNIINNHMQQTSPYGYLQADNNGNTNSSPNQSQYDGNNGNGSNNGNNGNNGNNNNGQNNSPTNPDNNSPNNNTDNNNNNADNGQGSADSPDSSAQNDGGSGNNNSQGNGQSSSNDGSSSNSQSGSGRGEGSSDNQRDYISIPNPLANDPSLSGQGKTIDDNQQFLAQNGMNFEGEHVPYSQVISEYTNQAYDGISQGKYPSNMENVIKDYFSSFN